MRSAAHFHLFRSELSRYPNKSVSTVVQQVMLQPREVRAKQKRGADAEDSAVEAATPGPRKRTRAHATELVTASTQGARAFSYYPLGQSYYPPGQASNQGIERPGSSLPSGSMSSSSAFPTTPHMAGSQVFPTNRDPSEFTRYGAHDSSVGGQNESRLAANVLGEGLWSPWLSTSGSGAPGWHEGSGTYLYWPQPYNNV